ISAASVSLLSRAGAAASARTGALGAAKGNASTLTAGAAAATGVSGAITLGAAGGVMGTAATTGFAAETAGAEPCWLCTIKAALATPAPTAAAVSHFVAAVQRAMLATLSAPPTDEAVPAPTPIPSAAPAPIAASV